MDKESLFYMSADQLEEVKPLKEIFDLSGKVAVVTGTVGLALHVISRLAECGAQVVFGSRTEVWGQMAEETLREMGYEVSFKQCDVTKVEDCYDLTAFAEKTYGPVSIVVPVAAVWGPRAFVDMKEEEWDAVLDTDLKGQYFTVQAAARSMIKAGKGGKIVTIASVAYRGDDMNKIAMMTNYNAAKGGVVGVTKGIAKELKQYGINANCVAPGGMVTPGAIGNSAATRELYGEQWIEESGKYGRTTPVSSSPDEVALMVLTMCTDVSNFMYGQVIEVDGGSQFSFQEMPWGYSLEGCLPE